MPWQCPTCKREFKHNNQWHSCAQVDVERHLRNKPEHIRLLYSRLIAAVQSFGAISINPVKTSIQVKAGAVFLSIRVKKEEVLIEFYSDRVIEDYPVFKSLRVSSKRVLHYAVLEQADEIADPLLSWLRESYTLVAVNNVHN